MLTVTLCLTGVCTGQPSVPRIVWTGSHRACLEPEGRPLVMYYRMDSFMLHLHFLTTHPS